MGTTLTEQIRGWNGHSPTARRAYGRLRDDASTIVRGITLAVREVRFIVGCIVDPPTQWPKRQR